MDMMSFAWSILEHEKDLNLENSLNAEAHNLRQQGNDRAADYMIRAQQLITALKTLLLEKSLL